VCHRLVRRAEHNKQCEALDYDCCDFIFTHNSPLRISLFTRAALQRAVARRHRLLVGCCQPSLEHARDQRQLLLGPAHPLALPHRCRRKSSAELFLAHHPSGFPESCSKDSWRLAAKSREPVQTEAPSQASSPSWRPPRDGAKMVLSGRYLNAAEEASFSFPDDQISSLASKR